MQELLDFLGTEAWFRGLQQSQDPIKIGFLGDIFKCTAFLQSSATLAERKYCIINGISSIPLCACGKATKYTRKNQQYGRYCSKLCGTVNASNIRKETCLSLYGVQNPMHVPAFKQKARDSYQKLNQDHIKEKRAETNLELFGVDNYFKTAHILEYIKSEDAKLILRNSTNKKRMTNTLRYNRIDYNQTHITPENLLRLNDSAWLYEQHITKKRPASIIANQLGVHPSTVGCKLKEFNIPIVSYYRSSYESEIQSLLERLGVDANYNIRNIIHGELDVFIPSERLAIEFCGLYWHSDAKKSNDYHYQKYLKCKAKNIKLLTIFEDEWITKKHIVSKTIAHILHKNIDRKVYARNTIIKEIDKKTARDFLNEHHIQGAGNGSIIFGLFHEDLLVAAMVMWRQLDSWILNRYATDCTVVGGFTKLLNHFEKKYNYPKIITFADLRWSAGALYLNNGFELVKQLKPDYAYTKGRQIDRYHKFLYRRSLLKNKLPLYDSLLSESVNMKNNGFYKIWDCGKLRFSKN